MKKRMLSVFLTLCMILTLLPTALAVDEPENPVDSASLTEVEAAEETTTEQEPDSAGAEELEKTEMSSSIQNQTLTVGEEYDFTVTTTVGSDVKDKTVLGKTSFDNYEALSSLKYYEVTDQQYHDLPLNSGEGTFGPEGGFQITAEPGVEIENQFKVTFNQAGDYSFTVKLVDVNTEAENSVIAELTASFKVQETAPAEDGSREHPFTTVDAYNTAIADDGQNGEDVYLTIDSQEFGAGEFALTNVQRRVNPPKLHLTLTDCTFNGNTSGDSTNTSFMYLSNCQELVIDGCTFDTESAGLVYGINWNLIQIEGATVNITDCTFSGKYEKNALKLNQRNGEDDAAVDVSMEGESPASIKSANIENCTFDGEGAIIQLGSAGKGVNGAAAPSTGGFPVTIKAADNSGVTVEQAYLMAKADEENPDSFRIALNPGQTGSKDESTGEGSFVTTKPVMIGDVGYDSLQEAVNAAAEEETGTTIVLNQNLTENVTIPVGANVIIDGQEHTLYGQITCTAQSENPTTVTTLIIKNLTMDGTKDGKAAVDFAIKSQNQEPDKQMALDLTVENCTIQNFKQQGMYLTNTKSLRVDGCRFEKCGGFNYALDLNLVAVQDAEISITNTTFEGYCGLTGAIKVAARGTNDGSNATDITGSQASVKSLTIEGCTFNQTMGQDIVLGVTTKSGSEANETGSFPVNISGNRSDSRAELKVKLAYKGSSGETITPPINATIVGDGTSDPAINSTVTGVAVVDGEDGFTPVTNPAIGQKLTANIQTSSGEIGSYPVCPDATYKWYYQDSTDTVLGTEAVYTVTGDNVGRVICVDVSVDGYAGSATWTASAPVGQFAITASAGAGGTITPSGTVYVNAGESQTFTITANSNYSISDVKVDGASKGRISTYTFEEVDANHTISATFSRNGGGSSGGGGGGSSSSSYTVTVDKATGGTVKVIPTRASKGSTVTITVTPDVGYDLDKLTVTDKNGDTVKLNDKGNDKYTFTMPSGKVTVKATFAKVSEQPGISFDDVSTSAYYYDAVKWAMENGVTEGTSATTFSPDASCTRAQMVTFLWRANGSPKAAGANPFTDVQAGSYYYDAVLWAVEKGITSGTSATTFAPNATVTRGQTVTFLHRANGSPAISGDSPFTDVASDAYYAAAVQWAVAEGVTSGTSATTFAPDAACTRAQIVTFLYRNMA